MLPQSLRNILPHVVHDFKYVRIRKVPNSSVSYIKAKPKRGDPGVLDDNLLRNCP